MLHSVTIDPAQNPQANQSSNSPKIISQALYASSMALRMSVCLRVCPPLWPKLKYLINISEGSQNITLNDFGTSTQYFVKWPNTSKANGVPISLSCRAYLFLERILKTARQWCCTWQTNCLISLHQFIILSVCMCSCSYLQVSGSSYTLIIFCLQTHLTAKTLIWSTVFHLHLFFLTYQVDCQYWEIIKRLLLKSYCIDCIAISNVLLWN